MSTIICAVTECKHNERERCSLDKTYIDKHEYLSNDSGCTDCVSFELRADCSEDVTDRIFL